MPLSPGTRLGPYEVLSAIGAGGMGEVYRARDTKLDRDVALKILPDAFTNDAERLARFQREAKVLASLNHPNIAAIYGLEDADDTRALILELVEGPTLADRIAQGPIPVDDALPIAKQIAEALEAAHEQGIIHRDLKPANIKLRPDGTVKVLDFGLAKALEGERAQADQANSPTLTAAASQLGVIMGTAAYMSPEQARGKAVDRRADIWAFGVVLYEMLTGTGAFQGEDISSTLARVIEREPDWALIPARTPSAIQRLLRRCLVKDRKRRVPDIGIANIEIDDTLSGTEDAAIASVAQPASWQRPGPAVAIGLGIALVTGLAVWTLTRPEPAEPAPITRMSIVLPQAQVRTNTGSRGVAISPTGTHVVYVADQQLYLRALAELEAQPLTGTEGSRAALPFFSPSGQWIGFYSVRDGALQKVALSGGAAVTLTEVTNPYGASWGADDTIVFGQAGQGILSVSGAGGTPEVLVSVDSPSVARQPQILPGGEAVLYTLGPGGPGQWDTAQIVVEQMATGERTVVVEGGRDARYLSTGHLVYALGNTLLAVPFDVDRLEVMGGRVPLVEGVSRASRGAVNADIARNGALAYLTGEATGGPVRTLVWVDRNGTEEALAAPPRYYVYPRLSPDGTRVTLDARDAEDDVWVWDLTRETLTRLTFAADPDHWGVWTPDARRVVFSSRRDGEENLYWRAADGTGGVERLTESESEHDVNSVSPDGERLVFTESGTGADGDSLYTLTLDDERRIEPLIVTEFSEANGEVSPDGRWLAYQSNASGQLEVYVQPFPNVDAGRWQISTTGGTRPLWAPGGGELFYLGLQGIMSVSVITADPSFSAGTPELLIPDEYVTQFLTGRSYDVSPDGQRFLMLKEEAPADPDDPFAGLAQIHVVLNWQRELLERVPVP